MKVVEAGTWRKQGRGNTDWDFDDARGYNPDLDPTTLLLFQSEALWS